MTRITRSFNRRNLDCFRVGRVLKVYREESTTSEGKMIQVGRIESVKVETPPQLKIHLFFSHEMDAHTNLDELYNQAESPHVILHTHGPLAHPGTMVQHIIRCQIQSAEFHQEGDSYNCNLHLDTNTAEYMHVVRQHSSSEWVTQDQVVAQCHVSAEMSYPDESTLETSIDRRRFQFRHWLWPFYLDMDSTFHWFPTEESTQFRVDTALRLHIMSPPSPSLIYAIIRALDEPENGPALIAMIGFLRWLIDNENPREWWFIPSLPGQARLAVDLICHIHGTPPTT